MEISNVTANTFDINVGTSEYTGTHTFVSATANGLKRQDGTFTINVGVSSDTSTHYFIGATAQAVKHEPQTTHNFASALADAIEHDKTAGLRGEETSSLTAFSKAVELMKLAITNNYTSTSAPGTGVSGSQLFLVLLTMRLVLVTTLLIPILLCSDTRTIFQLCTPLLIQSLMIQI